MQKVIVIVSGGFDPIHSGHISMFSEAKELGDHLIVGINSDAWLERKKGKSFLPYDERHAIVSNMKMVDEVIVFNDNDNTACDLLRKARIKYPDDVIIFANGGDRTEKNIPEMNIEGINFEFGIGGNYKKKSSKTFKIFLKNKLS
jgi:D-beta-D-heptose 7-phosphate kinase/D-beta-D-heptose 1-phosphate adenosyltransferase